jgi:hypothetical protein
MNHRSWADTEGTPLPAGSVATARWKKMTYDLLMGIIVLFLGVSYIVFRIADITTSDDLRSERCDISRRVLDRSQSVELG